jgi:proteic killer suppression protein
MIRSFADAATADFYHGQHTRAARCFPPDIRSPALRRLDQLDAAADIRDLAAPPGNRLERLHGRLAGRYSIRVNDQWRVVFRWDNGNAYEVWLTDYH